MEFHFVEVGFNDANPCKLIPAQTDGSIFFSDVELFLFSSFVHSYSLFDLSYKIDQRTAQAFALALVRWAILINEELDRFVRWTCAEDISPWAASHFRGQCSVGLSAKTSGDLGTAFKMNGPSTGKCPIG